MTIAEERFDVTARRFHQWTVVALSALAFVIGGTGGGVLMVAVGLIMIVGRFRDDVDIFRAFYASQLVPRGILRPRLVVEDRATRRIARVMGGTIQAAAGLLIVAGAMELAAWVAVAAIAVMIVLDAAADFCALCFVVHTARRVA